GTESQRGPSARVNQASSRGSRAVVDGPKTNRHRAGELIPGPADSVWGKFGCGKPSIRGAGDGELGPDTVARRKSIETGRRHRARQCTPAASGRRSQQASVS